MSQVSNRNASAGKRARTDGGRREDDWTCPSCGNVNFSFRTTCNMHNCSQSRPTDHNSKSAPKAPYAPPSYASSIGGYMDAAAPPSMYLGAPPYASSLLNGPALSPYNMRFPGSSAYPFDYGSRSVGSPYGHFHMSGHPYSSGSMMGPGGMYGMSPLVDRYGLGLPMGHGAMPPRPGAFPEESFQKKAAGAGREDDWNCPPDISSRRRRISIAAASAALIALGLLFLIQFDYGGGDGRRFVGLGSTGGEESVESEIGVVAADDGMCSEIGASMLRLGGHAVDAAVATAICSGVRHPMSSGIGGGAFIVVRSAADGNAEAFDARETAPSAASEDMYQNNPSAKSEGALSMGIPGEVAGLHAAWSKYGRLPWKSLFQPSINLARNGFLVEPYLALSINEHFDKIMADPGLRGVFAPDGKLLQLNDTCYNPELARSLEAIATDGPQALYNGRIGERFIEDTRNAGGIATMDDMRRYRVEAKEALAANVMGYTLLGMPPPSSGTAGISMVLNILGSYKTLDGVRGFLGLHRLIEATKHMLAVRMNLGDPDFVNVTKYVDDMLSPVFAEQIRQKILDNTTFGPSYYLARWSQLRDHGTSHISIVDAERNAVSMTTTVNFYFGSGVLSPSTGIVANNEMDDFSTPTDAAPDGLPPAPSNFIEPNKRPLSSMTPLIIVKDNQVAGVIGASGGMNIIPTVAQVFINHFVLGMTPLEAVQRPRFYHRLIPNVVQYENYTALDGERFEFSEAAKGFLEERHHQLQSKAGAGAVCQFVVQDLREPVSDARGRGNGEGNGVFRGMLTAVSDPRKDGRPAGL